MKCCSFDRKKFGYLVGRMNFPLDFYACNLVNFSLWLCFRPKHVFFDLGIFTIGSCPFCPSEPWSKKKKVKKNLEKNVSSSVSKLLLDCKWIDCYLLLTLWGSDPRAIEQQATTHQMSRNDLLLVDTNCIYFLIVKKIYISELYSITYMSIYIYIYI